MEMHWRSLRGFGPPGKFRAPAMSTVGDLKPYCDIGNVDVAKPFHPANQPASGTL